MAAGTLPIRRPLPPGASAFEGLRQLSRARSQPLELFARLQRQYGDTFRAGFGMMSQVVTVHPDGAEQILAHNHKNYCKGAINAQFRLLDGNGLVTSEGDFWVRQRRLAQPAFHRQRLAGLAAVMASAAGEMAERWRPYAREGRPVHTEPEMMRLALRIAGETLFGVDLSDGASRISPAVDEARDYITGRFYMPFVPPWLPTPAALRFRKAKALLDRVVYGIIRERRESGDDRGDLLSMFMLARDEETGESMNDLQLRDEVMTMLMAGHESTAVTMTWVSYLVAKHPEVQERLQAELDHVLNGRAPTFEDLPNLPYNRRVVEETLRLYPTVWALSRQAIGEDEIGGFRIPAGTYVATCQYLIHRHPDFWPDPERFDPERFATEPSEGRHRFAYFPFGAGPRKCIGHQFALMEAQLVLATVAQRYRMALTRGQSTELEPHLSLRLKGGVYLLLQQR